MTCYIVVESKSDIMYVRELLKPEFDLERDDIHIISAGGRDSADVRARSLLASRRQPTMLALNANSSDAQNIRTQEEFLEDAMGQVATRSRWRILLAIPSIEALLFSDRNIVEALVGHSITEEQFIRGQYVPRQILMQAMQVASPDEFTQALETRLPQLDFSALQQHPFACQLKMFVGEMLQKAAA